MRVSVFKAHGERDRRVAATPETVKNFISLGATVRVGASAGVRAWITDAARAKPGSIIADRAATAADIDIVLAVQAPSPRSLAGSKPGAWPVRNLSPGEDEITKAMRLTLSGEIFNGRLQRQQADA